MAVTSSNISITTISGLTTSAGAWTAVLSPITCTSGYIQNNATNGAILQLSTNDTTATTDSIDIAAGSYMSFTHRKVCKGKGESIINARWKTSAGDVNPSLVVTL